MKRFVPLIMMSVVCMLLFSPIFTHPASAHGMSTGPQALKKNVKLVHSDSGCYDRSCAGCYGASCYGLDPTAEHCTDDVVFYPNNKVEALDKRQDPDQHIVAYISSVYSYNCNANWDQATLSSYAENMYWGLSTKIETTASNGAYEKRCYPLICYGDRGSFSDYGGQTGWPTVSDMVDGTNQTYTTLYVFTAGGWPILVDNTIKQ